MKYKNISRHFLLCLQLYKKYTLIRGKVRINAPEKFEFGFNCHFGSEVFIDCKGGVTLGDGVVIANNVKIISYNHNFATRTSVPYDKTIICKRVNIEDACWIGQSALVAPGSFVGRGSVVGMGAVVSKKFDGNSLLAGNPAIKIRELTDACALYMNGERRSSLLKLLLLVSVR